MTLTVEDGSIVAGADTYVTLAAYQAYGAARGWTLGADDAADEIHLRRSFDAINRNWTYRGHLVDEYQVGAWPRDLWADIPQRIKDAQCELAYLMQNGLDVFATINTSSTASMIKVGPITIQDDTLPTGRPRIVAVDGLLRQYVAAGAGQIALVRG